jgi:hypothetical protein
MMTRGTRAYDAEDTRKGRKELDAMRKRGAKGLEDVSM